MHLRNGKKQTDGSFVYVDERGKAWKGTVCSACLAIRRRDYVKKYNAQWTRDNYERARATRIKAKRKKGITSRFESKDPRIIKSIQTELVAKEYILNHGITCADFKIPPEKIEFKTQSIMHGPDLIFNCCGIEISVEVKPAIIRKKSIYIGKVFEGRKKDDFIAVVLGDDNVFMQDMKTHLSSCSPCGTRTLVLS